MSATPRIIPTFRYADPRAAIRFLCDAFGFETRVIYENDAGRIVHAQLVYGQGMIMLSGVDGSSEFDKHQAPPSSLDAVVTSSAYIVVGDLKAHHARALANGARVVLPLEDQGHGWGYSARDPEGQLWSFGDYDPYSAQPEDQA